MEDLATLKSQLDATESKLVQYTSNLPSEIETQIQGAYTPLLQESLGVTRDQMSDYLGRYFDITSMGPGTQGSSAMDLSPTQKLGVMGRELGTMSGNLQASQRYSDYLGGQMNDMYQKAVRAAQLGQQNLADQYARQFQQYQLAWQAAEAAKDRANALAAARAAAPVYNYGETGGGDGGGGGNGGGGGEEDIIVEDSWTDKIINMNKGTDYSKTAPSLKSLASDYSQWGGLPASIAKTIGGAIGNLSGNWRNKDMNFIEKLYNIR